MLNINLQLGKSKEKKTCMLLINLQMSYLETVISSGKVLKGLIIIQDHLGPINWIKFMAKAIPGISKLFIEINNIQMCDFNSDILLKITRTAFPSPVFLLKPFSSLLCESKRKYMSLFLLKKIVWLANTKKLVSCFEIAESIASSNERKLNYFLE